MQRQVLDARGWVTAGVRRHRLKRFYVRLKPRCSVTLFACSDRSGNYQLICSRIPKPLIVALSKPAIFVPGGTVALVVVMVVTGKSLRSD